MPTTPPCIRNTAEAIFEWHACRWTLVGELERHGEEREKLVEKAMSSVRLDGFSENKHKTNTGILVNDLGSCLI